MTGLLLDAAVALLLLATIFYCVLLNRRLTALRASYDDLQRLFSGFSRSIERAEAGITGLKIAAQEVGGDLQERIDKARALADELAFLTDRGALVSASQNAIRLVTGRETELSTSGGTSDGRFIAPTGAQVVELGPINATIHKVNECVKAEDLDTLSSIYEEILVELLA